MSKRISQVVFWFANGFDPKNPHDVDPFSRESLCEAMDRYKTAEKRGESVCFLTTNNVVRDATSGVLLREVEDAAARKAFSDAGFQNPDMRRMPRETTGSPTMGLALAEFAQANPDARVTVFACTKESARCFAVMYPAVARYVLGYELRAEFVWPASARPDFKSRALYKTMRLVTVVAAISRPTFMALYNLINRAYEGRRKGFRTTIS